MSPTARSLQLLRSRGFTADVVERWNGFAKVRHDYCNVGDILAFDARTTLLVQCTTASNMAAREKKVRAWKGLTDWLVGGREFALHGWTKCGPRGKRKVWRVIEKRMVP
jgi:hypothetical protein